MSISSFPKVLAIAALLALAAGRAHGESALRLPLPESFGDIPAETLDENGNVIGRAHVEIDQLPSGEVRMVSESRIDGGGGNRLTAALTPVDGGDLLKPLVEESRTDLATGRALGFLQIDHSARLLRCGSADGESAQIEIPDPDRVTLTSMNLLFLPLVRREVEEVNFQVPMCRGGPRIIDAKARLAPAAAAIGGQPHLVEVRYELDFGPVLSTVAKPFLPRFSLWFDPTAASNWVAHRMPLYSKGPTVVVMRAGVSPNLLGLGN